MSIPRVKAVIIVSLIIGVLSLGAVIGVNWIGPMLAHGANVEHADGTVLQLTGTNKDFILATAKGQRMQFQCGNQCRASVGHLQRHIREKAHTDVYYVRGPQNILIAIDVD